MSDEFKNLNIDTCSDSELIALIRQTFPKVIIFMEASQKLLRKDKQDCKTCDKFDTCEETCELIAPHLPDELSGSHLLSKTFGTLMNEISDTNDNDEILCTYDANYLKAIDRVRSDEIYLLYKNCLHLFSKTEWRVVTLRIDEGQTFKAIGVVLGISTSTASDTFYRAKRRMEQHYKNK